MGCGASMEEAEGPMPDLDEQDVHGMTLRRRQEMQKVKDKRKAGNYDLDTLPAPTMTTVGIHPKAEPSRTIDELFEKIPVSEPNVYLTVSALEQVNVLFVYPDQNWNQFPPTKMTRAGITITGPGASEPEEGEAPPEWQCLRMQFKEFDSLDDVYKRWYATADGKIKGVMSIECAGPTMCWATMSPHVFQQRWCLPDGRRAVSLLDTATGIPQRIWNAYVDACGTDEEKQLKWIRWFLAAASAGFQLKAYTAKSVKEGQEFGKGERKSREEIREEAKKERPFDIERSIPIFHGMMKTYKCAVWATLWEFDPELGEVMEYLTIVEDALLRNWFETGVDANLDVDMWYFKRKDASQEPDNVGGIKNWLRKRVLSAGEGQIDDLMDVFKADLFTVTEQMLNTCFGGDICDHSIDVVEALYPDLKEWVKLQARSIGSEMIGVQSEMTLTEEITMAQMSQKLADLRAVQDKPLDQRRMDVHAKVQQLMRDAKAKNTPEAYMELSVACRTPFRVERHFFKFRFLCVFPMHCEEMMKRCKRPKTCTLVLWPERHYDLKKEIPMEAFTLKDGGKAQVDEKADKAVSKLVPGQEDIGSDANEDPRANWSDYDTPDFRGFSALEEVCIGIPYAFHFQMDGHTFLGAQQPIEPSDDKDECYYRRVVFTAACRPYTLNPLKVLGCAM